MCALTISQIFLLNKITEFSFSTPLHKRNKKKNQNQNQITYKHIRKYVNTGGHCSNSSGHIYDILVRMVVTEWFWYEIVITIECTISIFIVPNILVGLGCTFPSRCSCWFTARIYCSIYDKRVGDVCCRVLGYVSIFRMIEKQNTHLISFLIYQTLRIVSVTLPTSLHSW